MKKIYLLTVLTVFISTLALKAQDLGQIHGNFQLDAQYYRYDSLIGTPKIPEKLLSNGFMNLNYTRGDFYAGLRYESYLNPLSGFNTNYTGTGVPYRYAGYKGDRFDITVGNYYEQFGNGLIFRSYEDKNLGIDNAMEGIRLRFNPLKGIYLKGLIGKQRYYFSLGSGIVRGFDAEFSINEIISKIENSPLKVLLGGSAVSKYQADDNPIYRLPENVMAVAGRGTIQYEKISLSGEYAYKANDPSADNGFIYKPGEALLLNASYATKGLGITLSGKRIDNMSFRSDRNASVNDLTLNFLPAISKQHTYMFPAFYPYSTQPNGEIGVQGEIVYTFKKGSPMGGKYGTNISVNYSRIYGLDTVILTNDTKNGYKTSGFLNHGRFYYEDLNVEISKKLSNRVKGTLVYMHQLYDKDIIQGHVGYGVITSEIGVADVSFKLNKKNTIRVEAQHLYTKQDFGNWAGGLIEYTNSPHYFIAVLDQYNYGNADPKKQFHYYNAQVGYLNNTLRIALGYGRQREGIICVGGVCRNVPASNGITLSVTNSF